MPSFHQLLHGWRSSTAVPICRMPSSRPARRESRPGINHPLGFGTLLLLIFATWTGNDLVGQEAEVESSVRATLGALSEGRYDDFIAHFDSSARGFFLDGGPLLSTGFNVDQLKMAASAGAGINVELSGLDSRVHGSVATSVAYLEGSITVPGGVEIQGSWRYTETRVIRDGAWKVVQFHVSSLETGGMDGNGR